MTELWLALLVKIVATGTVVVAATYAAERSGPFWGSLIASLPVAIGPAYVLLAIETDAAFVARSAVTSFAAVGATTLFLAAAALLGPRTGLAATLAGSTGLWLAAAAAVRSVDWSVASAAAFNVAAFALAIRLTRSALDLPTRPVPPGRLWVDLPLRALLVGGLVAGVVTLSRVIGPASTGVAALFPVTFVSMVVVLSRRLGNPAMAATMARSVRAMVGFAAGLFVMPLAVGAWGTTAGLAAAFLTMFAWAGGIVAWRKLAPAARRRPIR